MVGRQNWSGSHCRDVQIREGNWRERTESPRSARPLRDSLRSSRCLRRPGRIEPRAFGVCQKEQRRI
ncbi:hypothetical protein LC1Hm_3014 [Halomicrobium sp. LC1Hm]|nr:hypothetical protein LC1Hm_3014 [Halomicrobium sp. LC1Hm]